MEANQMTKKIIEFQKGAFSSWYGVMTAMQEQAVSSMNAVIDQSDWIPDEGRRMVRSWVKACKKGREDYKGFVEESISGLEKVLVVKAKKSSSIKKTVPKGKQASAAKPKDTVSAAKQAAPATSRKPIVEEKPAVSIDEKEKTQK